MVVIMKKSTPVKIRKKIAACLLLVILATEGAGCGVAKEHTGEKLVLNEVAHSIFYAPLYVAIEEGYFAEEGIDLELVDGCGSDQTMKAVLADEADIGLMGCESTVSVYLEGTEDYVVNFALFVQRAGDFVVAREPVEDFTWDMLMGKTVLVGRAGGMPEMILEYILNKKEMNPATDLTIDRSVDFGLTATAFSEGRGDFTIEFEPEATLLEQRGDGYVVASLGEESGYVAYTTFSAKKSFIENNPRLIRAFTSALQKGLDYTGEHTPEEIAKVIAPQFEETDIGALAAIVKKYRDQDTWRENLIFEKESFSLLRNILKDSGVLEKSVPYEALVNTSYAKEAASK